jgi:hypothetical protein
MGNNLHQKANDLRAVFVGQARVQAGTYLRQQIYRFLGGFGALRGS